MHEREDAERKTEALINKLNELATQITTITGITITSNAAGLELIISKVFDLSFRVSLIQSKFNHF